MMPFLRQRCCVLHTTIFQQINIRTAISRNKNGREWHASSLHLLILDVKRLGYYNLGVLLAIQALWNSRLWLPCHIETLIAATFQGPPCLMRILVEAIRNHRWYFGQPSAAPRLQEHFGSKQPFAATMPQRYFCSSLLQPCLVGILVASLSDRRGQASWGL